MISVACLALAGPRSASASNTWNGGGTTNNWSDTGNWGGAAPTYGTITFSGSTRTTNTLNGNFTATGNTNMNQVNFTGSSTWTINNSNNTVLFLFDNSGTQAKVENNSSGLVTINAPITFAANNGAPPNPFGEINAVNGDLTFGTGTLTVSGSSVNGIKLFGSGRTVTFNNTINATGKWFGFTTGGTGNTAVIGGSVTSGDWYVMNGGTLKIAAGGSISGGRIRLGGDFGNTGNQNQTKGGTLAFAPTAGGISFGNTINSVSGNTSNALLIDSQNTSGMNTVSSDIFLDSDLKTTVANGGTLWFVNGTFDVKARKLTVGGDGITLINQSLSSSQAAGGFLLKENGGTLILYNTSNTYTGTNSNSLNANGTQIAGGTLGIAGDGSLGIVPANAYNNVQFTGSGKLLDIGNSTLNATRNVSIASGATATFDSNGNTFTINGVINGTGGNVAKSGMGTLTLGGTNTYSGTTTISTGIVNAAAPGALGGTSNVTINSGGTLLLTNPATTDRINNSATITMSGGAITFSGNVIEGSSPGTGALTLTANSIIDFAGGNAIINFGNSSGAAWTGGTTLSIYNWDGIPAGNGNDQLIFGIDNNALTPSQLAQVSFYSGNGSGFLGTATILSDGELVPIPEPGAVFMTLGLFGLVGYRERRRRRSKRSDRPGDPKLISRDALHKR